MTACTTSLFLHQNKPPRESIFCDKVSDWWTERALIMLNFLPKTRQNNYAAYTHVGNATESTYACNQQRRRLQGRPRTTNEVSIMQRQRHAAIYRRLSTGRKHTELLQPNPLLMHNHVLPHTNGAAISQQRLEFENHLLSAINAQRCHALKPNKHTNCP